MPKCEFCGAVFQKQDLLIKHLGEKHRDNVKLALLEHPERQPEKTK
jgi:uncharacterized C2H2 Zn-finger protein